MRTETRRAAAGLGAFAVLAAAITTAAVVLADAEPAGASELTRFASCAEMRNWVDEAQPSGEPTVGLAEDSAASMEAAPAAAPAPGGADASARDAYTDADPGTGGTNTVVEGVDEIDIVDRLPGGRALVTREGTLWLVELEGLRTLATHRGLPLDARISVGGDVVWVAGSNSDGNGIVVTRLRLGDASLTDDGTWRAPGWLVDARRTGDRLHVLATDQPHSPGAIPFEDGPVPCDQVWRPEGGADTPAASLLATLPASGELTPTATAEVVGAGSGFLVTGTAAYVTTQRWDRTLETGVHRFDLATLTPTGSGTVPGAVPGPFGLNEHDGHLRVATNEQPTMGTTGVRIDEPSPDIAVSSPAVRPPSGGDPLAEVFVLDLQGALDVVGRTGRFGHAGESIQGVRFVGPIAYVVTFLQTDPFWVLDLSDPTAPKTVGELEIPGFSGYLHPVDDDRVVGFGPDGKGQVAVRLFDVSDRTTPRLVDELPLGDESPVAFDHHAYVGLDDGRFAVPVTTYPTYRGERCDDRPVPLPQPMPMPEPQPAPEPMPVEPDGGGGSSSSPAMPAPACAPVPEGGSSGVAVLDVEDGRLVLADKASVDANGDFMAQRVLPTPDGGWVLVGYDRLVDPDGGELLLR